jgi:GR25 family glycosyltransferase involved in LPS biosynthesis
MAVPWDQDRVKSALALMEAADAHVIWDETHDAFATWRRVLAAVGDEAAVVLEDDVILTQNWREKVEAVIAVHPGEVIQFFSMRADDLRVGSRSEPGRTYLMNQCHYLPPGAASSLLAYSEDWKERAPEHPTGMDTAMARWMQDNKMRYWLHVPSLVQHRPWKSAIARRSSGRQSRSFVP